MSFSSQYLTVEVAVTHLYQLGQSYHPHQLEHYYYQILHINPQNNLCNLPPPFAFSLSHHHCLLRSPLRRRRPVLQTAQQRQTHRELVASLHVVRIPSRRLKIDSLSSSFPIHPVLRRLHPGDVADEGDGVACPRDEKLVAEWHRLASRGRAPSSGNLTTRVLFI